MATPAQAPAVTQPPVAPVSGSKVDKLQAFREVITALISIGILLVSLWMLVDTYRVGKVAIESNRTDEKQNAAELKAKSEAYARRRRVGYSNTSRHGA